MKRHSHFGPSTLLLGGQLVTAGTAFAINILSSNVLDPSSRGYLAFFLQISYVATTLCLFGIERPYAAARGGARFSDAIKDLNYLSRHSRVGISVLLLVTILLLLLDEFFYAAMTACATAYLVMNLRVRQVRTAYIASRNARPYLISIFATQGLLLILGTALYLASVDSPVFWLSAYAISASSSFIIAIAYARRSSAVERTSQFSTLTDIQHEGLRLLPASFGNTALMRSDRLLLPLLASPAELGRYVAVATVMEIGAWPVQQWVDASLSTWRLREGKGVDLRRQVLRALLGAVGLSFVLAVGAVVVVRFLLPPDYLAAQHLVAPLAFGTILYAASRIQQGIMIARGKPGSVSIAEVCGMVVSVLIYLLLIPHYGAMGAAIGSAAGSLVLLVTARALGRHSAPSR